MNSEEYICPAPEVLFEVFWPAENGGLGYPKTAGQTPSHGLLLEFFFFLFLGLFLWSLLAGQTPNQPTMAAAVDSVICTLLLRITVGGI